VSQGGPSIELIIRTVATACAVTPIDIRSDRRNKHAVLARHTGMWLARKATLLSYPAIGKAFGRRDHSSVMYAVSRIEQAMEDDPRFAEHVLALARILGEEVS
jgi:chromosomal replication initiator protein